MTASHFDHLPIPAFALDGEGKIVSWNHAMAALSGVEASGLLGQGVRALPLGGPVRTAIFEALQGQAGTVKVTAAAGGDQPFLVQPLNGGEDGVVLVAGASTAAPRVDGPVVKTAVAGLTSNIMLADKDFHIVHMNERALGMFRQREPEFRALFPGFAADRLVGQSMDIFHRNPAKQRALLADPSRLPYQTHIAVGGLHIDLSVNGVFDSEGALLGYLLQWTDVTARKHFEDEVNGLLGAVARGQLGARGAVARMDAVYGPILTSVNQILGAAVAPIDELRTCMTTAAAGDLTHRLTGDLHGDHAALRDAFDGMVAALSDTLAKVRGASDQIASGSGQVAASAQSLAQGATTSAAAIEEIGATIRDMANQSRKTAASAGEVDQLATAAGQVAVRGDDRMKGMLRAMDEIDEASQRISKIIKVIDEIAFQTNLLALNAAVEAARAGVHGRGFAVVAEEVRNLAARSATAARETTQMIETTIVKVGQGSKSAHETARALEEIVESVTRVKTVVAEIAQASNEQAEGIAQINVGLEQVDRVTQQNTAAAEESAAASEELSTQARTLRDVMTRFTLRQDRGRPSASAAPEAGPGMDLTPELLAALQAYMAGAGAPAAAAPRPAQASARGRVLPSEIISLDDAEFGRY
jgi:methyl-accepting chemotaxis protein